jgi:hypothetical protein
MGTLYDLVLNEVDGKDLGCFDIDWKIFAVTPSQIEGVHSWDTEKRVEPKEIHEIQITFRHSDCGAVGLDPGESSLEIAKFDRNLIEWKCTNEDN